jgi:hypothetical protein
VESQSWAGAAAKLRQKLLSQGSLARGVRNLGIGCLQNISNVARGRWSKSHLHVRRRAADGSRYEYWPWAAKGRLLHLGRLCTASIVLHKAEEPEAECWWPGAKACPRMGPPLSAEKSPIFDCASPRVLDSTEPPPLKKTVVVLSGRQHAAYDSYVWRMCTGCCASLVNYSIVTAFFNWGLTPRATTGPHLQQCKT